MQDSRAIRRALVLTLSLLSTCAVGEPAARAGAPIQPTPPDSSGAYSAFLNAHFAASQADSNVAAQEYLRALSAAPDSPDLLRQALMASIVSGRADAIGLARRLPGDPMGQILLGNEAARSGDWQGAQQRFDSLPQTGVPKLLRPLLAAWAQQGAGQTDRALARLEPLLSDQHFGSAYALHAALIADLAGRTADAARFYAKASENLGFRSMRMAQILASFTARQGHEAEALRDIAGTAQATPMLRIALPALAANLRQRPVASAMDGMAEAYLDVATALRQDNQDQFAMVLVQLALTVRPGFAAARMLGADVLEADGHADRALQMLASIGADNPLSAVVQMRRAELEARVGNQAEALQQLHDLSLAYSDSSLPDAEAGDILRMNGDYAGATAAYSRAIARIAAPSALDWPLFYDRGVAYKQSNEWPKAEEDFQKALQLEPNQPIVLNYLGYSWADRGEHLDDARRMIESAARQRPDDGAVIDSLGWVMLRLGETENAVRTLERASELQPEDPTINSHLGDAYWAADRKMEATYQWRRALTLNPLPADAAKLQAKLHETTAQATTQETHFP